MDSIVDTLKNHGWDIWSGVIGLIGGGALGSLVTFKSVRGQNASDGGVTTNQSRARASGDIIGGNKTSNINNNRRK